MELDSRGGLSPRSSIGAPEHDSPRCMARKPISASTEGANANSQKRDEVHLDHLPGVTDHREDDRVPS